jgi:light-dependent protochlorophyllide reductase
MTRRSPLLLLASLGVAVAFKGMSNWKLPTLKGYLEKQEATEKFGDKKLVVITGTSSGLGRKTARALLRTGKYHVVGAVRDLDKMDLVAELEGFDPENFTPMHVELNNFTSVREFCSELATWKSGKPLDRLICNAGVYQPSLPYAKWSVDGHEQQMQINYLSHFLMCSILLPDMAKAQDPRVVLVGSVTGNDNTVGGGGVYPIADLKQLEGLKAGAKNPISMFDGYNFIGAKAYKDSKLCL